METLTIVTDGTTVCSGIGPWPTKRYTAKLSIIEKCMILWYEVADSDYNLR